MMVMKMSTVIMMQMMMMMITSQGWLRASMQGCHSQEVPESELLIKTRKSQVKNETRPILGWVIHHGYKDKQAPAQQCVQSCHQESAGPKERIRISQNVLNKTDLQKAFKSISIKVF